MQKNEISTNKVNYMFHQYVKVILIKTDVNVMR